MTENFRELPTYDRIQALVRDKQYLRDLGKVQSAAGGMKQILAEKKVREKYGLFILIDEEFARKYSRERLGDTMLFEDVDPVVSIIPAGKVEPSTETTTIKGEKTILISLNPRTYILRKGRFLTLEIDLKARGKDIERLVEKRISTYKKIADKRTSHEKRGEYDPWDIWDMHKKQGLSLVEIARRKSGISGSPNYNDNLRAYDRCVRRAYKKASSMIESVGK
jgi:hypothetical protein